MVPVRTARSAKDEISRRVVGELHAAGIAIASTTATVTLRPSAAGAAPDEGEAGPPA